MKLRMQSPAWVGIAMMAAVSTAAAQAQQAPAPPPFQVIPPPQAFKTSTAHYEYLKRLHKGGTQHTWESVPKWEGIWQAGWNSIALRGGVSPFFVGAIPTGLAAGGEVAKAVLSPSYEAAFIQRREGMKKFNQQPYDRLTTCEPAGMPRWLLEPYAREFVNTLPNRNVKSPISASMRDSSVAYTSPS